MRPPMFTTGIAICVFAVSGCGGKSAGRTTSSTAGPATAVHPVTHDTLVAAVRRSLSAYHQLSIRCLWSNTIGARPAAIAGPALLELRTAIAQRRKRGVRVRVLSDRFRVTTIRLDPSFMTATAVVADPQRVRPYGYDGRPLGNTVRLDEHARIELRRVDRSRRFVVWKVSATR